MTKGRKILIAAQVLATLLFVTQYRVNAEQSWLAWFVPLTVLILIAINSAWFTRFVSWLIFSISFFGLLVVLSAFTLRWRGETAFAAAPFYQAMLMYAAFVYISLGQIKILGGASHGVPEKK